jgi:hypothetical protein
MKLFKDTKGFIFSFGFNPLSGQEAPKLIAWNDPTSQAWQPWSNNQAGNVALPFVVDPEFVFETIEGICAYQAGKCIRLSYVGGPTVWKMEVLVANV